MKKIQEAIEERIVLEEEGQNLLKVAKAAFKKKKKNMTIGRKQIKYFYFF